MKLPSTSDIAKHALTILAMAIIVLLYAFTKDELSPIQFDSAIQFSAGIQPGEDTPIAADAQPDCTRTEIEQSEPAQMPSAYLGEITDVPPDTAPTIKKDSPCSGGSCGGGSCGSRPRLFRRFR